MKTTVFIILQIFFGQSHASFENWGISLELGNITRIFPNFGWGILCHVTRFDQSRASENI